MMYPILLLVNALLWIGCCVWFVTRPWFSVFHPAVFYLMFHGIVFAIRPPYVWWVDYRDLYYAYEYMPSMLDKETVMQGAMLALVVVMWVFGRVANRPLVFTENTVREYQRDRLIRPFLFVCLICLPLALYSLNLQFEERLTGISTMLQDRSTGISVNTGTNAYIKDSHQMLVPLTALFAWLMRFRLWSLIPFAIYVLTVASLGSRWPFVIGSASVALLFLWDQKRLFPSAKIVVPAIALLMLFSAIGQDRGASLRQAVASAASSSETASMVQSGDVDNGNTLVGMDFAGMEYFEYLVYAIPQRTGTYSYFLDNLQILTEPIPRAWWPGKPVGPPIRMYNLFDYGYPIGMSYTLPGEGWRHFGWLGILLWCSLCAYVIGRFYVRFTERQDGNFAIIYYLLIIPHTLTFYRDGLLLTFLKTSMFFVLPPLMLQIFTRMSTAPTHEVAHHLEARSAPRDPVDRAPDTTAAASSPAQTPRERREALAKLWHG